MNQTNTVLDQQQERPSGTGRGRLFTELYEWVEMFAQVVVCVVLLFAFVTRTFVVSGDSMRNTLHDGEMLVTTRAFYTPKPGDIVTVFRPDNVYEPIVKRVIATEGQSIDIDFEAGVVSVDGEPLDEPYIREATYERGDMVFPLIVPEGHVFVMGDNRNHSMDSRFSAVGLVDERNIMGRAYWRILPFAAFGGVYDTADKG